jgi:hypothetical protein
MSTSPTPTPNSTLTGLAQTTDAAVTLWQGDVAQGQVLAAQVTANQTAQAADGAAAYTDAQNLLAAANALLATLPQPPAAAPSPTPAPTTGIPA